MSRLLDWARRQKIENLSPEKESEAQEVLKQMSLKFKDFVSDRRDIEPT